MGAFGGPGGGVFGGAGGAGPSGVGVALQTLIDPAYRIAGISLRALVGANPEMYQEAIGELNRLMGSWNCARPNIFTIAINAFNISNGTKAFLIGTGATPRTLTIGDVTTNYGAFNMQRPQAIQQGVIGFGPAGQPGIVRMPPMYQMDSDDWANISLQDIPNGVPLAFYYDSSYDPLTGFAVIYLWTQTTQNYSVEWYTWQLLPTFTAITDMVALPPGYEAAIVYNLAKCLANLNPTMANMSPDSYRMANQFLAAIEHKNAQTPKMVSDYPQGDKRGHYDFRVGFTRYY